MKKSLIVLGISLSMMITSSMTAFAGESVVTPVRTISNAYYFHTDMYSSEDNLMPFTLKLSKNFSEVFPKHGYADGNCNIVIPMQEEWRYAGEFVEGIAVVKGSDSCTAIDGTGTKLFNLDDVNVYGGLTGRFKDDSNGYVAYTVSDNGSIYYPGNPVMTTYDRAGNKTEYHLNYDKIEKFIDGYANVYEVDEIRESNISFNGGEGFLQKYYSYKVVGSINSKGEFFKKTNKENEQTFSLPDLNNGYSLKVKEDEGGWGAIRVLVDSNGTEYGKYLDVDGVINGNQFIGRPYKTREEVTQYINQHGENRNGFTGYYGSAEEYLWCDLTPRTIFEVKKEQGSKVTGWVQDSTGWWYRNADGSYPINAWKEINSKQYYFGADGYMLHDTTTPDGYTVGSDGVWIQPATVN